MTGDRPIQLEPEWLAHLQGEFDKAYMQNLRGFLRAEQEKGAQIFPPPQQFFAAFNQTPFSKVKLVILGQDPYHGPDQANGLAFSVEKNTKLPPSLRNIYKEIENEYGTKPQNGDLSYLAAQGVLLLNATLSVRAHQAGSHQNKGWEQFTDAAIQALMRHKRHLVFLLWGAYAGRKAAFVNKKEHLCLYAPHPSPLSAHRGFLGCNHFRAANDYLTAHGHTPINWV